MLVEFDRNTSVLSWRARKRRAAVHISLVLLKFRALTRNTSSRLQVIGERPNKDETMILPTESFYVVHFRSVIAWILYAGTSDAVASFFGVFTDLMSLTVPNRPACARYQNRFRSSHWSDSCNSALPRHCGSHNWCGS